MRYNPEKLIELTRCLLPEDPSLVEEVRFSIQNPRVYLQYYKQKRSDWKEFRRPTNHLPWLALINGLHDRNLIFEFSDFDICDDLPTPKEPRHPIRAKRRAWVIKEGRWSAEYAWEQEKHPSTALKELFIEVAAVYLDKLGYVLCELVPSYHLFTLTIMEKETADQCKELARESGFGMLNILPHPAKPVLPPCPAHPANDPGFRCSLFS
ncbi:DUF6630 family protein [Lihuaxuella thermophila]|uniref:DUF6630 domain-containing protein n=1 Tax=Lihuaxuella thermophila TaxID=1173111 RepID=A0A1H8ISE3_9BACL|nr:hypothetical protein [Lihuaxuella thermophila]SEN70916.1 hypothetical protein SAMN05444955_1195 [Lihuaxuella thermophila]